MFIQGKTGSGKSTLLNVISGLDTYEEGEMYIDGKETEIQKVNTAFLGCKIESGNHELKIIYHAPGTTTGKILSLIGIAGFLLVLVREKRKQKNTR